MLPNKRSHAVLLTLSIALLSAPLLMSPATDRATHRADAQPLHVTPAPGQQLPRTHKISLEPSLSGITKEQEQEQDQEQGQGQDQDQDRDREHTQQLLQQFEALPSRVRFERASARPAKTLWSIAAKPGRPMLRLAALDALSRYWPSARALQVVSESIDARESPLYLRLEYVALLGRGDLGEGATVKLALLLGSDDLQLQMAAASALGQRNTARSRAILREQLRARGGDRLLRERVELALR